MDDGEGSNLLHIDIARAHPDGHHEIAQHADVGTGEKVDQMREMGKVRTLSLHQLHERGFRVNKNVAAACRRDGVAEDPEVHRAVAPGRQNPSLKLLDEGFDGLRP